MASGSLKGASEFLNYLRVQLTLEQHRFELQVSTYTSINSKYYSATGSLVGLIPQMQNSGFRGRA